MNTPETNEAERGPGFCTARDVALYLTIPLPTVYHLAKQGRLPAVRIGGRWKFYTEEVHAMVVRAPEPARKPAALPPKPKYQEKKSIDSIAASIAIALTDALRAASLPPNHGDGFVNGTV